MFPPPPLLLLLLRPLRDRDRFRDLLFDFLDLVGRRDLDFLRRRDRLFDFDFRDLRDLRRLRGFFDRERDLRRRVCTFRVPRDLRLCERLRIGIL